MSSLGPRRIAVVDDDASVRRALRRLLQTAGLHVEDFASAGDFLASLASGLPDCLVLDLHMPGMDGLALQAALAWSGRRLPIVVITGRDAGGMEARCRAAGAGAYLVKPVGREVLLQAIDAAIVAGLPRQPLP